LIRRTRELVHLSIAVANVGCPARKLKPANDDEFTQDSGLGDLRHRLSYRLPDAQQIPFAISKTSGSFAATAATWIMSHYLSARASFRAGRQDPCRVQPIPSTR
jgi:hypothetical protein